ncbi:MAG: nuclear transport factor 2 family protein, partial [Desulfobacterales bacterium]|nr:nuclear transport factor 2 family protein [Desulfobacterales bacterium]
MMLSRQALVEAMEKWNSAWDAHDLEGVLALFHDEIFFENWTGGKVSGKNALRKAWQPWFENHGGFKFISEDLFVDEQEQKVLYRWTLKWPSPEKGHEGKPEKRRGVDVIHFKDGKIIEKLTYCKTRIEINGQRYSLTP